MKVKSRFTDEIIGEFEISPGANLSDADLRGANLYHVNLSGADLSRANLRGADLYGADLRGADLYGADLRGADLRGADLYGADLRGADLSGANLSGADLRDTKYSLLQSFGIHAFNISDELCIELMKRDAMAHPNPQAFTEWSKGGNCPLESSGINRMFNFPEKREIFEYGKPQLTDWQLWVAIAEELEIKI